MSGALALLAAALIVWPAVSPAAVRLTRLAAAGRVAPGGDALRFRTVRAVRRWPVRRGRTGVGDGVLRALALLAQELRDGADPARAWAGAADAAGDDHSATWMRQVAQAGRSGQPIGPAIVAAAQGPATPRGARAAEHTAALERLGAAWECGAGSGASAADMLDQWLADAHARRRQDAEIDSQLAGPRASTALLAALPLLGLSLGAALGADPLGLLLGTPAGAVLLAVGAALEAVGLLWVRRIIAAARSA